jgi:hypothetical protein
MHARAVDGAAEQLAILDDPVAVVQEEAGEDLVRIDAQPALDRSSLLKPA